MSNAEQLPNFNIRYSPFNIQYSVAASRFTKDRGAQTIAALRHCPHALPDPPHLPSIIVTIPSGNSVADALPT